MNTAMEAEFKAWYAAYPRKVKPLAAMKAYEKARKLASAAELLEGVERYRAHKPAWQAWAHPTSWLNAGCWGDQYGPVERTVTTDSRSLLESMGHYSIDCERIHGGTCKTGKEHYERREAEQAQAS